MFLHAQSFIRIFEKCNLIVIIINLFFIFYLYWLCFIKCLLFCHSMSHRCFLFSLVFLSSVFITIYLLMFWLKISDLISVFHFHSTCSNCTPFHLRLPSSYFGNVSSFLLLSPYRTSYLSLLHTIFLQSAPMPM